jgi:hypothetical protein
MRISCFWRDGIGVSTSSNGFPGVSKTATLLYCIFFTTKVNLISSDETFGVFLDKNLKMNLHEK